MQYLRSNLVVILSCLGVSCVFDPSGISNGVDRDASMADAPAATDGSIPNDAPAPGTDAANIDAGGPACDWMFRRRLTFDNSQQAENLMDFPVLVALDSSRIDYQNTQDRGQDLRFLDADGVTPLAHEIARWNEGGTSYVWVKVPQIDSASATDSIWMYYGNASATDTQAATEVWTASYMGVWHLDEDATDEDNTTTHRDSTARGINCTQSQNRSVIGHIAQGQELSSNDFMNCGTNTIPDGDDFTITAWTNLNRSTGSSIFGILSNNTVGWPYRGISLFIERSTGGIGNYHNGFRFSSTNTVSSGQWSYLAIRSHKSTSAGYVEISMNGSPWESILSGDTRNLAISTSGPLNLGRWGGGQYYTEGIVDEIRVANTLRSREWIAAQHLTTDDAFISYGTQETAPSDCTL